MSFLTKETRLSWKSFLKAMESGGRLSVGVGIACAVVGNIIGITNLTGLGLVLGDNIVSLAGGSALITTFLTKFVCIILGMGLPTSTCYILTATIAEPALMKPGVNPLAAHMFTYYFACLSNLTPPVAIASYGAAGLSGQSPSAVTPLRRPCSSGRGYSPVGQRPHESEEGRERETMKSTMKSARKDFFLSIPDRNVLAGMEPSGGEPVPNPGEEAAKLLKAPTAYAATQGGFSLLLKELIHRMPADTSSALETCGFGGMLGGFSFLLHTVQ